MFDSWSKHKTLRLTELGHIIIALRTRSVEKTEAVFQPSNDTQRDVSLQKILKYPQPCIKIVVCHQCNEIAS